MLSFNFNEAIRSQRTVHLFRFICKNEIFNIKNNGNVMLNFVHESHYYFKITLNSTLPLKLIRISSKTLVQGRGLFN